MDRRIERVLRVASRNPDLIGLAGGLPAPELFPRARLGRAFASAVTRPMNEGLQYGWPEGNQGLRAWIAARLRKRGADVHERDVIVTSGAQQALAIAAQILSRKGPILVEPETYPAALALFRAHGGATSSGRASCTYVVSGISNPRGLALDERRRSELLEGSRPIVADEAYAELRFDGNVERPLLADARDRVWHVGSFSKTLCPGLRVGFLVPPPGSLTRALRVKHEQDLQAGSLAQTVLEEFLAEDDFDARLERARTFYARRAERLHDAIRKHVPELRVVLPEGGFSLWAETDEAGDDVAFLKTALEHGVSFDPGRMFRCDERSSPIAFRSSFSSNDAKRLREGAERLGRAFRAFFRSHRTRRRAA